MMIGKLLKEELKRRNISAREAARQAGVSHTTIFRVMDGKPADLPTLEALSSWMGISMTTLLKTEGGDNKKSVAANIAAIVEKRPELARVFSDAIRELEEGVLSEDDVAEIVSYAAYKIQLKNKEKVNGARRHKEASSHEGDR